ncbi:MAG TPA: bifunctional molybdopterin-guanine dinucleotide biosynthesis adaptor protein MobB/molybdopterin molybdotransferase MoeA [Thiolinea sp.]|nr:bifunctional molybdopterin-guanine dinucleotide biosynthesis adaptor protein MobB/molybdopterin molybdotransferase MoeA [Thiolinea sp.]
MIRSTIPLIGFCAYSGTGKTTLLTRLIPLLKARGLRLTVIKHGHHSLELDQPGKDSFRFREAGADQVILASLKRVALMHECPNINRDVSLTEALKFVQPDCADLILVEGFKHENYPKIEVHRPSLGRPLLYPDDTGILALAVDQPPELPAGARSLPLLDMNTPETIADFIMQYLSDPQTAPAPVSQPSRTGGSTEIHAAASCMDDADPYSHSYQDALSGILDTIQPLNTRISRNLRDSLGLVLAENILSPHNVPSHTNSAMDGYALRGSDLPQDAIKEFRVAASIFAGQHWDGECGENECVRIMTGAPMPAGTDTVVMQEQTEVTDARHVRIGTGHRSGQNVRLAGEDIAIGQTILQVGRRLTPADLGLMASLGRSEVKVFRPPRVAFFSTGDELRSVGETLEPGCVYDSNRYTLYGMLRQLGMEILDLGVVRDDPDSLKAAFTEAAAQADVVITSGGVSVGEADFTKDILAHLGHISFWKIAIKPGRPLAFGHINDTLFFGLPGNPVAVMVTFQQLVQPALLKLAGEQENYQPLRVHATCQSHLRKKPGRTEFIRGISSSTPDGQLMVERAGHQGSGILTTMSRANCFIVLPEANAGVEAGDTVIIQPFARQGGHA